MKIGKFKQIKPEVLLKYVLIFVLALFGITLSVFHNISITEPEVSISEEYLSCIDRENDREKGGCVRVLATNALAKHSPREIEIEMLKIDDLHKLQWCHEFYHYIGWDIYKTTQSLPEAFAQASNMCDSGMFHGIVEEYIAENSHGLSPEDFVRQVPKDICTKSVNELSFSHGKVATCTHGLGHGFMLLANYDLKTALAYCDMSMDDTGSCYTGIFMENVQSKQLDTQGAHVKTFAYKPDDPDYPCSSLDEKHKTVCYQYKGVADTVLTGGDFRHAFLECLKIDDEYHDACFNGVGANIPGPHITSERAGKECIVANAAGEGAYKGCISGAISFILQLSSGDIKEAEIFCNQILDDYREFCFSASGGQISYWLDETETVDRKCNLLSNSKAQQACKKSVDGI